MPNTLKRHCAFCGATVEGFNAPVSPIDPSSTEDPPGTGWHQHAGPSYGLGFEGVEFYCSDECLERRVLRKEEPTRVLLPFERSWRARRPEKRARTTNAKPKPVTVEAAAERAELAETTLASAEETIEALAENLEVMSAREEEYVHAVENLTATVEQLKAARDYAINAYHERDAELTSELERLQGMLGQDEE